MTRGKILVVDDDSAIRNLVTRVLRREAYDTSEAVHGADALDALRAQPFDAVMLDLMMPVMSGYDVVRYLETHQDAGSPCVIIMTAAVERDVGAVSSTSVHAVLRKPFELAELLAAVDNCHREHRR